MKQVVVSVEESVHNTIDSESFCDTKIVHNLHFDTKCFYK